MEEIIKITEKDGKRAVNARELHHFLESKQDFSNWIKNRIEKYGFVENQDFEVYNKIIENPQGGRPTIEYALSVDMAKELSMVENNEKGRLARKYFIECEKIAREAVMASYQIEDPLSVPNVGLKSRRKRRHSKQRTLKCYQRHITSMSLWNAPCLLVSVIPQRNLA
jgi:phage anti-repressor protein